MLSQVTMNPLKSLMIVNRTRSPQMIYKVNNLREQQLKVRNYIQKFRLNPKLVHKVDHLWDDIYVQPGDTLEWIAISCLPFVHHRMLYIGDRHVIHANLPKTLPPNSSVQIDSIDKLRLDKPEITKRPCVSTTLFTRYQIIMNALHSTGAYPYCPVLANCQNIYSSWQGVSQLQDTNGVIQVLASIFMAFFVILLIEFYIVRLIAKLKLEIHSPPLFIR